LPKPGHTPIQGVQVGSGASRSCQFCAVSWTSRTHQKGWVLPRIVLRGSSGRAPTCDACDPSIRCDRALLRLAAYRERPLATSCRPTWRRADHTARSEAAVTVPGGTRSSLRSLALSGMGLHGCVRPQQRVAECQLALPRPARWASLWVPARPFVHFRCLLLTGARASSTPTVLGQGASAFGGNRGFGSE
jgi:hypothetical protein